MNIYYIGYQYSFYRFQSQLLLDLVNFYPLRFVYVAGTNLDRIQGVDFQDPDNFFVVGYNAEDIVEDIRAIFGSELQSKLALENDFLCWSTGTAKSLREFHKAAKKNQRPIQKLSRFELLVIV